MQMFTPVRIYVAISALLGAVSLFFVPPDGVLSHPSASIMLLLLVCFFSSVPVRISSLKLEVNATPPLAIALLGLAGGWGVVSTAILTVTCNWFSKRIRKQSGRWSRLVFNYGTQLWISVAAAWVFVLLGGTPAMTVQELAGPLAVASICYFLLNTLAVSIAVYLDTKRSLAKIWIDSFLWQMVSYVTSFTIAVCLLLLISKIGTLGLVLALPPCWMMIAFYREHQGRLKAHQQRLVEVEDLNAELEDKVRDRTQELQQALQQIQTTNEELTSANKQLKAAHRSKSEFLANMTHELRTPLNSVIGFSDLMNDESMGELNEQQKDLLSDIRDSGEHLLGLINDILDLAKLDSHKMEMTRSEVGVLEQIQKSLAIVRPLGKKKSIDLSYSVDPQIERAFLDAGMFRGAIVNLLSNAIKFTPEQGRITVDVTVGDQRTLIVKVADNGIGISQQDQERIFEEFYQADGSFTREYQGTGLGLTLVHRIMKMHEGSIRVNSVLGQGTTFTCEFPESLTLSTAQIFDSSTKQNVDPPSQSGIELAKNHRLPIQRAVHICLFEPKSIDRQLMQNVLKSKGHRVLSFSKLEDVSGVFDQESLDLLILSLDDFQNISTWLSQFKRRINARKIRVVGVTENLEISNQFVKQAGVEGLIQKPIRLATFPAEVVSFISNQEEVA